jgi:hypothetical protein
MQALRGKLTVEAKEINKQKDAKKKKLDSKDKEMSKGNIRRKGKRCFT